MPHATHPEAIILTRRPFRRAPDHERKHDLIRATLECVAENGIHAATVRAIAVRAGVTSGLIRHYFESKNNMIEAAYRTTMTEMTALVKQASQDAENTAGDRLRQFIAANLSTPVIDIKRLTLWASFISRVHVDAAMAEIHREHYLDFRRELEPLVGDVLAEAGRPAGQAECRRATIKINAAIDGLWLEGTLAPELFVKDDLVAIGVEAVEGILGLRLSGRERK